MSDRDDILIRPNHVEAGLDLLLGQFHDAPNLQGMIEPLLQQVQDLEDMMSDLFASRTLDIVTDDPLDQYGVLVGEGRGGFTDSKFRRFIRIRILSNFAQADIERVLKIIGSMAGASATQYDVLHPAGYQLSYRVSQPVDQNIRDRISDRAEEITGSGIGVGVVEYQDDSFAFSGSQDGQGFGLGKFAITVRIDS